MSILKKIGFFSFIFLLAGTISASTAEKSDKPASEKRSEETILTPATGDKNTISFQPSTAFFTPFEFFDYIMSSDQLFRYHCCMMQRVMKDFFVDPFSDDPFDVRRRFRYCSPFSLFRQNFSPNCDLKEKDDSYELTVEAPGISGKEPKITVSCNILTASGEKREVWESETEDCRSSERSYGLFQRSFTLPAGMNLDAIKAKCKNGVLTISIPKSKQSKKEAKTIPIES